jgi:hypothetical protein
LFQGIKVNNHSATAVAHFFIFIKILLELKDTFIYNKSITKTYNDMKKILTNYFLALLACFAFGVICALVKCYSAWYLFLLSFIFSFGWMPYAHICRAITPEKVEDAGWILVSAFIVLIVVFIAGLAWIQAETFLEITFGVSMFTAIITTLCLIFRIRNIQ